MTLDQTRAPIADAIQAFYAEDRVQFTTPGHKSGHGIADDTRAQLGCDVFHDDLAMAGGVDDRKESRGIQTQAQELAAEAYGADEAIFSTNGTSLSVQVAIMTVARPGETLVVDRGIHKSAIAGLILGGVHPIYVAPAPDRALEVRHGVTPESLARILDAHPEARGAVIVSPTYYGVSADVRALAEVCHARGKPLVVDEAWGAHFAFHPDMPPHASSVGADLCLSSIHKTIAGLGTASVILRKGDLVDADRLKHVGDLLESTSASSIVLASIDTARRQMVREGRQLLDRTLSLAREASAEVKRIPGLDPLGQEVVGRPGAFALDETKLVVDVRLLGMSGYEASDWLDEHCGIRLELADHRRVMALITIGDSADSVHRLVDGFRELSAWAERTRPQRTVRIPAVEDLIPSAMLPPRDAFFAPARHVPLEQAAGEIAAETLSPYPPGIPSISPGEQFSAALIEFLRSSIAAGANIPDASDPSLETVRVAARTG